MFNVLGYCKILNEIIWKGKFKAFKPSPKSLDKWILYVNMHYIANETLMRYNVA